MVRPQDRPAEDHDDPYKAYPGRDMRYPQKDFMKFRLVDKSTFLPNPYHTHV